MAKAAFYTLGCKVNQYDTEALVEQFCRRGYEIVDWRTEADVYVINTCAVTGRGEQKSRQMVKRLRREHPEALIVVVGCYPQVAQEEVRKIPGVNLVVGTGQKGRIFELLEEAAEAEGPVVAVGDVMKIRDFEETPIGAFEGRTRATVKIQEGCTQFCSYCIIPYARGPMRSREPEKVTEEIKRLVEAGYREVVLTGIHLGAYGRDLHPRHTLAALLHRIHPVPGLERIRLSSVEPTEVDEELIQGVKNLPKVCRHLHIPLQSGSDRILKRMNRPYRTADYARVIEGVRDQVPEVGITTDVMVGFPGETEEDLEDTLKFVGQMAFSRLHVFKYSPRRGTPAARMTGRVPAREKERRSQLVIALGEKLALRFGQRFVGETVQVLVEQTREDEECGEGCLVGEGLTDNYLRVVARGKMGLKPNSLVRVLVTAATKDGLRGTVVPGAQSPCS